MAPTYKLTYFNQRGGGELIRLIFAAAKQQYEDERLTKEEWIERKPWMPMKNLPVLTIDGVVMCQSGAIARYLARKFALAGDEAWDMLRVDEVYEAVQELRTAIMAVYFEKDPSKKAELLKNFEEGLLKEKFYNYFLKRLKENKVCEGRKKYLVGTQLTLADITLFNTVDGIVRLHPGILDPFPEILEHYEMVAKEPGISEWLETRPKSIL